MAIWKSTHVGECPECGSVQPIMSNGALRVHYKKKKAGEIRRRIYCEGWPNRIPRLPKEGTVRKLDVFEEYERDAEQKKDKKNNKDRAKRQWAQYVKSPHYAEFIKWRRK